AGGAPASPWGRSRPYISRTFPLAINGRSAIALTAGDATSGSCGLALVLARRLRAGRRIAQDTQAGDDLLRIADVVLAVEDRAEVQAQLAHALVLLEQPTQVPALRGRLRGALLHEAVSLFARPSRLHQREQH